MNNHCLDFQLSSYSFQLPKEHIAQIPAEPRHNARMLMVPLLGQKSNHGRVWDLINQLQTNDLLIVNNTKVLRAKLIVKSESGPKGELLLLESLGRGTWLCLAKPSKIFQPGKQVNIEALGKPPLAIKILDIDKSTGGRLVLFPTHFDNFNSIAPLLEIYGNIPMPPYITKQNCIDDERYQTRYADKVGAVAAPTAGLHFSDEMLSALYKKNIHIAKVTLHIGLGTFRPIRQENLEELKLHTEWVEISRETVNAVKSCQTKGGRVIAIGTTTVRALEGSSQLNNGELKPFIGPVNIVIKPGYQFKVVDALFTNFHFPDSSLLFMVSAFIGRVQLLQLYQEAIGLGYRFFSYGDSMWISPQVMRQTAKSKKVTLV
uniref:Queuosine biosynthesis protein n=1 Tax=Paulinella chromatophora TaxID=39717 RepID=B1X5B9_PAUCH|nr:Queuosine biosynthesis protein [Paulinella chromatophora]ACB43138.1 Queuosine biosynthesis protein [Paulinella chromatophora]